MRETEVLVLDPVKTSVPSNDLITEFESLIVFFNSEIAEIETSAVSIFLFLVLDALRFYFLLMSNYDCFLTMFEFEGRKLLVPPRFARNP